MTTIAPGRKRLLATWDKHRDCDLASHLNAHGALPLTRRPEDVWTRLIAAVEMSGLAGRGGAGFPTARKLRLAKDSRASTLVVNSMEAEPESRKDWVLVNYAPHLVLDGAEVVALALGIERVVVCVAANQPQSVASLRSAIAERRGYRIIRPRVDVITLADRLVAGEESAIAAGVDGRRPVPVFRPDKSVPIRVGRNPALVQNAETLAQVGLLFRYGPDWFRTVGTDDSPGTTLVTIVGSVALPGVHEVPFGLPIGHIVDRAGPDANWSAVLVGGYGGTWLGASARKVLYEPRALAEKGAAIGPGVLLVLGASKCGLAETARIARYMARESAGQCGPCLHGLPAIAEDLTRLVGGHGDAPTLERIRKRCRIVTGRGACKHPDGLARLVVSSLRVFSEDAEIHSSGRPCSGTRDGSILAIGRQSPESFR